MAKYIERTEELVLTMNAGARVIENTRRYHGTVYSKDVSSEAPQKNPVLTSCQSAEVLPSNKVLTNADRIRAATNQQLAKLLYDNQKNFCRLMYKNLELEFSEDYSDILAWLNTSEKAEKALEAMKNDN